MYQSSLHKTSHNGSTEEELYGLETVYISFTPLHEYKLSIARVNFDLDVIPIHFQIYKQLHSK